MTKFINYYEYIKSEKWYTLTKHVRERNEGRCECCDMRKGTQVHHRTYARLGNEFELDLLHVCKYCHKMIHKKGEFFIWPSRKDFLKRLQEEIAKETNSNLDLGEK